VLDPLLDEQGRSPVRQLGTLVFDEIPHVNEELNKAGDKAALDAFAAAYRPITNRLPPNF
jgi:hypothetical protein